MNTLKEILKMTMILMFAFTVFILVLCLPFIVSDNPDGGYQSIGRILLIVYYIFIALFVFSVKIIEMEHKATARIKKYGWSGEC